MHFHDNNASLKRQVKAMTTTTFGSQDSGINRVGLELPNTNAFAMEKSNPLHDFDDSGMMDDARYEICSKFCDGQ